MRWEGDINGDLNEIQTNLVPFPRLHFMIESMSPIWNERKMESTAFNVQVINEACTDPQNFMVKIRDFDYDEDKYMAISEYYRGYIRACEANATVPWLKTNKKCQFVEWCPTGFKIFLSDEPLPVLEDDDMAYCKRHMAMIGNNCAISRVFNKRITKKFDVMWSQRAFVYWYAREGMEESEFQEAREDMGFLEQDYMDVLSEQATETDSDEDDY